jgi:hypothetical protein
MSDGKLAPRSRCRDLWQRTAKIRSCLGWSVKSAFSAGAAHYDFFLDRHRIRVLY